MTLSVTAYQQLTVSDAYRINADNRVEDMTGEVDPFGGDYVAVLTDYTEETWPGRTEGLQHRAVYTYADRFKFMAGSYMNYNRWRDHLARMIGFKNDIQVMELPEEAGRYIPFYQQIHFTDCDGWLGSVVASKLLRDYNAWYNEAEAYAAKTFVGGHDTAEWFMQRYNDWRQAFEMAADGGAVRFR